MIIVRVVKLVHNSWVRLDLLFNNSPLGDPKVGVKKKLQHLKPF